MDRKGKSLLMGFPRAVLLARNKFYFELHLFICPNKPLSFRYLNAPWSGNASHVNGKAKINVSAVHQIYLCSDRFEVWHLAEIEFSLADPQARKRGTAYHSRHVNNGKALIYQIF